MFTCFYFQPMNLEQMKEILFDSLNHVYGSQCDFLPKVYENYFSQVFQYYSKYTTNVNEFVYLFRFLYPRYVQKLYDRKRDNSEIVDGSIVCKMNVDALCKHGKGLIDLFDSGFKAYMAEIQSSLFMHMNSMQDVE